MEQSRYNGLDILKCICAFLIIIIHTPFDSVFSDYLVALARIAVPVFLMITGFFISISFRLGKRKNK